MNSDMINKILSVSNSEIEELKNKTNQEIEEYSKNIINNANLKKNNQLENLEKSHKIKLEQKEQENKLLEKQYINVVRREVLDNVINKSIEKLKSYQNEELLNLVSTLIKNEDVVGDEVIKVNKNDYDLFKDALSTEKKSSLIKTDLLNKMNKNYSFKLSDDSVNISSGFILVGKYFDLNFDFKLLIESVSESIEKELSNTLFN